MSGVPPVPEIGQRIGPFELVERLGAGRGTSVYRARRLDHEREPATVVIRVANAPEDNRAEEFVRVEYEALRSMNDPRIPEVYGYYAGQAALALRWYPGITLTDACQARRDGLVRIDARTALDIVIEIAHALRHAHGKRGDARPVVHGHLGSQRVRLTEGGDVVVTGFGANAKGRHTAYTSPEMAAGEASDARSDQWALGAIAVELLLGERLYDNLSDARVACLEGRVEPWVSRIERAWPAVGRILRRMLATEPRDRFDTDQDLIRELLAAERELPGVADRSALVGQVIRFYDRLSATRPPTPEVLPPKRDEDEPPEQPTRRTAPRTQPVESSLFDDGDTDSGLYELRDATGRRSPAIERPSTADELAPRPVAPAPPDTDEAPPDTDEAPPDTEEAPPVSERAPRPAVPHGRLDLSALGDDLPEPVPVDLSSLDAEAELGRAPSDPEGTDTGDDLEITDEEPAGPSGIPDFQTTELMALAAGGLLILVGVIYLVATVT